MLRRVSIVEFLNVASNFPLTVDNSHACFSEIELLPFQILRDDPI